MIKFFLCWAAAIAIYYMGIRIGRRQAEQEFQFMRWEMELDDDRKEGADENTSRDIED